MILSTIFSLAGQFEGHQGASQFRLHPNMLIVLVNLSGFRFCYCGLESSETFFEESVLMHKFAVHTLTRWNQSVFGVTRD